MHKSEKNASKAIVITHVSAKLEKRANVLADQMMGKRDVRTVLQAETVAVSCAVRDDLITARKSAKSAAEFRDDCIALYGTDKTQEEMGTPKVAGRIVEIFESRGYSRDTEKTLRSDTKVICAWFTASWETAQHALVNEKGRKVSHSDLAKLARKALGRTSANGNGGRPAADAPADAPAPTTTTAENIEQYIARVGVQTVLAACAKILRADKKTALYGDTIKGVVENAFKVA